MAAADHRRTEAAWMGSEPQAGGPDHARGQPALPAARKFVVTTDSNHGFRVYPNLAGSMELTGIDQLWRADITYIRLETEFVYLAVVLDAFSRRVIGWALDRSWRTIWRSLP
jgi:transposase InsO family protein